MRRLALVGAGLVMLGGLTACGGSPDDASEKDFCAAVDKMDTDNFDDAKDAVEELGDVGTPEGISDDAREGFEFLIDEVDNADNEDDIMNGDDLSDDEKKQTDAFFTYVAKTCA